ncbi:MAG: thiol reductant ABC exporter subunit CydD, partial [Pseudomonadota bacterium]
MTSSSSFLKSQVRSSRMPLGLAAGCSLVNGILLILQYWLLASVVGDVVFAGAGLDDAWPRLWPILAIVFIRAVVVWGTEAAAASAAARVKLAVRQAVLDRILALGPVRLADRQTGELAATLVDGVEALEPYYARFLPAMILAALVPSAILVVVAPADWLSGLILAVTAPMIPLFMVLIGKGAERLNQRQWARLARMSAHFLEVLQNLTTLKLFNASRREAEVIAKVSEDYRLATMSVLRVAFLSALALEFFATVSIALVAVFIGFRLLAGDMDFHRSFFVLLLAPEFYLPLRSLGAHYHARMEAIGAATRIVELMDRPVPPPGNRLPHPKAPVAVRFEAVGLIYGDGRMGLDGADFRLEPNTVTALVGPSGAGKSSVVSLLLGFVRPTTGRILVNGHDLGELDLLAWREAVTWVPQRPYLFRGTIADNLRLGAPEADDEALARAADLTGAASFIENLPDRYDHAIGERGIGLSGGQVRLLALTRAALRNTPLLILDEPTASLDRASEQRISAAVRALSQGRTILVVAHRLETVRDTPAILVFDRGRVAEHGDHRSLMDQGR